MLKNAAKMLENAGEMLEQILKMLICVGRKSCTHQPQHRQQAEDYDWALLSTLRKHLWEHLKGSSSLDQQLHGTGLAAKREKRKELRGGRSH